MPMAIEPLIAKLNENLKVAQNSLRMQLSSKVGELSEHLDNYSRAELRDELEGLVEEFLSQFTSTYQEFIAQIEDEIPDLTEIPRKSKPRKKPAKKDQPEKEAFVRPTYVHRAFTDEGLRVSKEARPMIMDFLNETIKKDIERIKQTIPTFQKGEKEGEKKRITIMPEDISKDKLTVNESASASFERELDNIPVDELDPNFKLLILLRSVNPETQKTNLEPESD
jgi:hypothetical protein